MAMVKGKVWIAAAGAALTLTGGIAFAAIGGGDQAGPARAPATVAGQSPSSTAADSGTATNGKAGTKTAPTGVTLPTTAPPSEKALQVLEGITTQLEEAVNRGGEPHELTREEAQAIVDSQLAQLGIKPSR